MAAGGPLPLAAARMGPAHHVTLGPLRCSQNDSTSGSWQGAGDRQVMSRAPRAAVPAGLGLVLSAGCLCPEHTHSSLLRGQGATSSCQTFAGQHKRMEAKLLPSCLWPGRIRVLLGMREWREGACSVQATGTAGRREEDRGSLGGRRGTGRETTQQRRRRGLEEEGGEGLWRHTSSSSGSSGSPGHQALSLAAAAPALLSPLAPAPGLLPLPGGTQQPPWGHG